MTREPHPTPKHSSSGGLSRWDVEWHQTIDSTMSRSVELVRSGVAWERVVVADFQTAGRGTHGRSWVAPSGSCLMFSFALRPGITIDELTALPLQIASTVAERLVSSYAIDIQVDPPNDLVVAGRKLAGVLCQSHLRGEDVEWVVCGIGLNTNLQQDEVTVTDTTSLRIETGHSIGHPELLEKLLESLARFGRPWAEPLPCPR